MNVYLLGKLNECVFVNKFIFFYLGLSVRVFDVGG